MSITNFGKNKILELITNKNLKLENYNINLADAPYLNQNLDTTKNQWMTDLDNLGYPLSTRQYIENNNTFYNSFIPYKQYFIGYGNKNNNGYIFILDDNLNLINLNVVSREIKQVITQINDKGSLRSFGQILKIKCHKGQLFIIEKINNDLYITKTNFLFESNILIKTELFTLSSFKINQKWNEDKPEYDLTNILSKLNNYWDFAINDNDQTDIKQIDIGYFEPFNFLNKVPTNKFYVLSFDIKSKKLNDITLINNIFETQSLMMYKIDKFVLHTSKENSNLKITLAYYTNYNTQDLVVYDELRRPLIKYNFAFGGIREGSGTPQQKGLGIYPFLINDVRNVNMSSSWINFYRNWLEINNKNSQNYMNFKFDIIPINTGNFYPYNTSNMRMVQNFENWTYTESQKQLILDAIFLKTKTYVTKLNFSTGASFNYLQTPSWDKQFKPIYTIDTNNIITLTNPNYYTNTNSPFDWNKGLDHQATFLYTALRYKSYGHTGTPEYRLDSTINSYRDYFELIFSELNNSSNSIRFRTNLLNLNRNYLNNKNTNTKFDITYNLCQWDYYVSYNFLLTQQFLTILDFTKTSNDPIIKIYSHPISNKNFTSFKHPIISPDEDTFTFIAKDVTTNKTFIWKMIRDNNFKTIVYESPDTKNFILGNYESYIGHFGQNGVGLVYPREQIKMNKIYSNLVDNFNLTNALMLNQQNKVFMYMVDEINKKVFSGYYSFDNSQPNSKPYFYEPYDNWSKNYNMVRINSFENDILKADVTIRDFAINDNTILFNALLELDTMNNQKTNYWCLVNQTNNVFFYQNYSIEKTPIERKQLNFNLIVKWIDVGQNNKTLYDQSNNITKIFKDNVSQNEISLPQIKKVIFYRADNSTFEKSINDLVVDLDWVNYLAIIEFNIESDVPVTKIEVINNLNQIIHSSKIATYDINKFLNIKTKIYFKD